MCGAFIFIFVGGYAPFTRFKIKVCPFRFAKFARPHKGQHDKQHGKAGGLFDVFAHQAAVKLGQLGLRQGGLVFLFGCFDDAYQRYSEIVFRPLGAYGVVEDGFNAL